MNPFFVLSYPRSRTAWLSAYLNAMNVAALHEGWKHVKDAEGLYHTMDVITEDYGYPVVNVDCSNVLFLPEIRAWFPSAKFIAIRRPREDVEASLKKIFPVVAPGLLDLYGDPVDWPSDFDIEYNAWDTKVTRKLMKFITGYDYSNTMTSNMMHGFNIQISPQQIQDDLARVTNGDIEHIRRKVQ